MQDFLLACFQKDPTRRPGAAALLRHRWVRHHRATLRASWSRTAGLKARGGRTDAHVCVSAVVERILQARAGRVRGAVELHVGGCLAAGCVHKQGWAAGRCCRSKAAATSAHSYPDAEINSKYQRRCRWRRTTRRPGGQAWMRARRARAGACRGASPTRRPRWAWRAAARTAARPLAAPLPWTSRRAALWRAPSRAPTSLRCSSGCRDTWGGWL